MISSNSDLEELKTLKVALPKGYRAPKSNFKEVSHIALVEELTNQAKQRNWEIGKLRIGLSKDKGDMSLGVELKIPRVRIPSILTPCIGVVNSCVGRRSIRFYSGVLDGGVGITLTRDNSSTKHSKLLNLEEVVSLALDWFLEETLGFEEEVKFLKNTQIKSDKASGILLEACLRKLINWRTLTQVGRIYLDITPWELLKVFSRLLAKGVIISTKQDNSMISMEKMLKIKELVTQKSQSLMLVGPSKQTPNNLW